MNDGRVHLVQVPMCHWRLSSTSDGDEQGFVRGKKRDGRRAAQGWQLCWQGNSWRTSSSTVNWAE